eukprot:9186317-Pyramimonas_sp.AAC.1
MFGDCSLRMTGPEAEVARGQAGGAVARGLERDPGAAVSRGKSEIPGSADRIRRTIEFNMDVGSFAC